MLSLIEVEWSVIIEKHLGPLRVKFNTKQTPLNLSEVESKFIEKRHVSQSMIINPACCASGLSKYATYVNTYCKCA